MKRERERYEQQLEIIRCKVKQTQKIAYFLKNLVFFTHDIENRDDTFDRNKNESVLVLRMLLNAKVDGRARKGAREIASRVLSFLK